MYDAERQRCHDSAHDAPLRHVLRHAMSAYLRVCDSAEPRRAHDDITRVTLMTYFAPMMMSVRMLITITLVYCHARFEAREMQLCLRRDFHMSLTRFSP